MNDEPPQKDLVIEAREPIPRILDDAEVNEIAGMFPHAEYQPTLSPDEVDPCEFCKGTIDDHKANCVVPHVHALRATVRAQQDSLQMADYAAEEYKRQAEAVVAEVQRERDGLRERLAQQQETLKSLKNCQNKPVCGHCAALLRAAVKEQP